MKIIVKNSSMVFASIKQKEPVEHSYNYPNVAWVDDTGYTQLAPANVGSASFINQPAEKPEANNNKYATFTLILHKGDKVNITNGHSQSSSTSLWGLFDFGTKKLIYASDIVAATTPQVVEHTIEQDEVYFVISALVTFSGDTSYSPMLKVTTLEYVE